MWISFLQISYVSLLDIWMVSCIAFITLVLLEFPIVHTLIRKDKKPLAAKVENCALFIIPVMFAIYNIIYWLCLIYGWFFIISSTSLSIQHAWNWTNLSCVSFDISLRSSIQNYIIHEILTQYWITLLIRLMKSENYENRNGKLTS